MSSSPGCRVVLPTSAVLAILEGRPIPLPDLGRRIRASLLAYAIENNLMDESGKLKASAIISGLPENPSIEEWSAFTPAQKETYPDEIYFAMESKIL